MSQSRAPAEGDSRPSPRGCPGDDAAKMSAWQLHQPGFGSWVSRGFVDWHVGSGSSLGPQMLHFFFFFLAGDRFEKQRTLGLQGLTSAATRCVALHRHPPKLPGFI